MFFWDVKGIILNEYLKKVKTITDEDNATLSTKSSWNEVRIA